MTSRKFKLFISVIVLIFLLTSCKFENRFTKSNIDLKVASRESLLGAVAWFQDEIVVLEQDSYGRTLYGFRGRVQLHNHQVIALGIIQESTKDTVSFYDGKNMLVKEYLGSSDVRLDQNLMFSYYNGEDMDQLKERNDWEKPVNSTLLFTSDIINTTPMPLSENELEEVISQLPYHFDISMLTLLSIDKNGKMLYLANEYEGDSPGVAYLIMVTKDGKVNPESGIYHLDPTQYLDYFDELNSFKTTNNWAYY